MGIEQQMRHEGKAIEKGRTRRADPLPAMARKLSELAAQMEEAARLEAAQEHKDDERVRAILNTITSGLAEKLVKSSPLLSDDDRAFMRQRGWR
jgi:hypothetical protein